MFETLRLLAVYFGSCALFLWIAHRTVRAIPRPVALCLVLAPCLLVGSALFSGRFWGALNLAYNSLPLQQRQNELPQSADTYDNGILSDHVSQVVPWRYAVRESIKHGHWPLWNRFANTGEPLLGLSQAAPFDPKVWLGLLLPLATAMTFAAAFVLFETVLFGYLFFAELGLRSPAAVAGALVWMLSGFVTFWVVWSMSSIWAVLPLVLLGVRRIGRGQSGGLAITTAGWALALVGGHPESVLHIAFAAGLLLTWELGFARLSVLDAVRRCATATVAGVLAMGLTAAVWLPFVEVVPQTIDAVLRKSIEHSLPLREGARALLAAVFPLAWDVYPTVSVPGAPSRALEIGGIFVGAVPLFLAFWGLAAAGPKAFRRDSRFFAGLALLTLLLAIGTPGISDLLGRMPFFDRAHPSRLAAVTAFSLAALAAFGCEAFMTLRSHRRGVGAAVFALIYAAAAVLRALAMADAGLAADRHLRFVGWCVVAPLLLLCLLDVLPAPRSGTGPLRKAMLVPLRAGALLALVILPRYGLPRLHGDFPAKLFYPPLIEFSALPVGGEPYRLFAAGYDLIPAQSTLWGLEDIRGPHILNHLRFAQTFPLWCTMNIAWYCRITDVQSPFVAAMNGRFLVIAHDRQRPGRFDPVRRGSDLALFESRRALPRAFAPPEVRLVSPDLPAQDVVQLLAEVEDFRRVGFVEADDAAAAGAGQGRATNGTATVVSRVEGPDLVVTVAAEDPTWIMVSEVFWKGWRAELRPLEGQAEQRKQLPLHFGNHAFLAFQVPTGKHEVWLTYRPRSFVAGLWIGLATVLGLGTTTVLYRRRLRLRRAD